MNVPSIEVIKREILDIYSTIRGWTDEEMLRGPVDLLRPCFDRLDELAALDVEDEAVQGIFQDPEMELALEATERLRRIFGVRMEINQAKSILDAPNPWDELKGVKFYTNYQELARMEFEGAGLHSGDRVAFLGSGPLPLSLIALCKLYEIEGVGIEEVQQYTRLSQKVLAHLGLANRVQILSGDHFSIPLDEECQLIMVGSAAVPKVEIFAHLARVLPSGAQISYRIYEKGLRRILNARSEIGLPDEFREIHRVRPELPVNNTVVFVIKS